MDLLIRPDGTYNEIVGTLPDARFPLAEVPERITTEAMFRDYWSRQSMNDL